MHKITDVDEMAMTATCSVCGPDVALTKRYKGHGKVQLACRVKQSERWARQNRKTTKRSGKRVPGYRLVVQEIIDLGLCQRCGFSAEHPVQLEVDHIVPVKLGGSLMDRENLQVLCCNCHKLKTHGAHGPSVLEGEICPASSTPTAM
jgi:5-methylcytosine-specific restriction endonuclease McrA